MRATGVVRQPGWIGGVCTGIAERIGIDPLIVRGIVVVVAVLGGPAILLYAAAWLLLPDRFDQIHLERLFRGTVDAPIAAIAGLVVLSMLPVTQGFWTAGAAFWHSGATIGRAVWTVLLLAALVAVIVWVARRSGPTITSAAPPAAPAAGTPAPDASTGSATAATSVLPTPIVPLPKPERPGADATTEDFAAWRDQQSSWKAERAAFQAQEAASLREVNLARAQERREAAAARNAVYVERRAAWLRANPRLSGGIVASAIGFAILAGGIAALVASTLPTWKGGEVAAGLGVATLVLGIVIVVAAAFGRRNGFMVFLSVVVLVATLLAAAVPNDRTLVGTRFETSGAGSFSQLAGSMSVTADAGSTGTVDLWQGIGNTDITIEKGETVRVEIVTRRHTLQVQRDTAPGYVQQPEDSGVGTDENGAITSVIENPPLRSEDDGLHYTATFGPATVPDRTIRLWQGTGSIYLYDQNEKAATK
jgi:phage shock protein PspC (stress-responsive transcriptional regulator)